MPATICTSQSAGYSDGPACKEKEANRSRPACTGCGKLLAFAKVPNMHRLSGDIRDAAAVRAIQIIFVKIGQIGS
jgi:hypothetical protein